MANIKIDNNTNRVSYASNTTNNNEDNKKPTCE